MVVTPYCYQSIQIRIEERNFGTDGEVPGQTTNFPGQHRQFNGNSRFSRKRMKPLHMSRYKCKVIHCTFTFTKNSHDFVT